MPYKEEIQQMDKKDPAISELQVKTKTEGLGFRV
jgi:hypothetical protein